MSSTSPESDRSTCMLRLSLPVSTADNDKFCQAIEAMFFFKHAGFTPTLYGRIACKVFYRSTTLRDDYLIFYVNLMGVSDDLQRAVSCRGVEES